MTKPITTEIAQVKEIFCHLIHAKWKGPPRGETFAVTAYHSDCTDHDLGKFSTEAEADAAAVAWKKQYLLPNESSDV